MKPADLNKTIDRFVAIVVTLTEEIDRLKKLTHAPKQAGSTLEQAVAEFAAHRAHEEQDRLRATLEICEHVAASNGFGQEMVDGRSLLTVIRAGLNGASA